MREEKVKDYTFSDVSRHLEVVLDLVPWKEMAQSDFVREDVNTINTVNTVVTCC